MPHDTVRSSWCHPHKDMGPVFFTPRLVLASYHRLPSFLSDKPAWRAQDVVALPRVSAAPASLVGCASGSSTGNVTMGTNE